MENITEFNELIEDLLKDPLVRNMATMKQHCKQMSLLDHLLYTAYVSYKLCDRFHLDKKETVRAALLHDFRLEDAPKIKHTLTHSRLALAEATKYFDLTEREKNIIVSHMWPLNITLIPKSKEAFVVNIADTYCATMELLSVFRKSKAKINTSKFSDCVA